jgi:hypothetical protein
MFQIFNHLLCTKIVKMTIVQFFLTCPALCPLLAMYTWFVSHADCYKVLLWTDYAPSMSALFFISDSSVKP